MLIALHKRARTTPAVRAKIAASREPVAVLARRYNVSEATIRKWRARDDFVSGRPVGRDARVCLPERVALRLRPLFCAGTGWAICATSCPPRVRPALSGPGHRASSDQA